MAHKSLFTKEMRNEQSGVLRPVPVQQLPQPDNRNWELEKLETRVRLAAIYADLLGVPAQQNDLLMRLRKDAASGSGAQAAAATLAAVLQDTGLIAKAERQAVPAPGL